MDLGSVKKFADSLTQSWQSFPSTALRTRTALSQPSCSSGESVPVHRPVAPQRCRAALPRECSLVSVLKNGEYIIKGN